MQPFDDRIKEQFSDFSPEVPPHIWENIVAKKKKRRPFFWIWPLLLLGVGLLFTLNMREDRGKMTIETGEEKGADMGSADLNKGDKRPAKSNPAIPVQEQITTDIISSGPSTTDENPVSTPVVNSNELSAKSITPETKEEVSASAKPGMVSASSRKNPSKNSRKSIQQNPVPAVPAESAGDLKINSLYSEAPANSSYPSLTGNDFTGRNIAFERSMPGDVSFRLSPPAIARQEIPCPERDAAGNKKYLEFYAGPDIVFRSFKDTGTSDYLQKRKETTSIAFAYSTGARFTKVFKNGMSIRTGINYSHIREKFTLTEGNVIQMVFIIGPNGDTIGNYSTRGTLYRRTFNKYNSVDIPLSVGYELGNGRLHANINAGVIVNVYSWQKGLVVDTANKAVNISTGAAPSPYQFKSNIGVGFLGSASFYYKMNERMHILAEPYFRYNLSSFNKEEITLKQKFHTSGLRLGIRYDLK